MCTPKQNDFPQLTYPKAPQDPHAKEVFFGDTVTDIYRPLENPDAASTKQWVQAENEITQAYLHKIPFYDRLKKRLMDLSNYEKASLPFQKNGTFYQFKNSGLQNQSVLYTYGTSLDNEPTVVLDPNLLSEDGTVALNSVSFSKDGQYMAYQISRNGSDWQEILVWDLKNRQPLSDHIKGVKFSVAAWHRDGFYYSAYGSSSDKKDFSSVNNDHKVYYHQLGTPQKTDKLIFKNPTNPKVFHSASVSEDERFLYLSVREQHSSGNKLYIKRLHGTPTSFVLVADDPRYVYEVVDEDNTYLYLRTNFHAPLYKIVRTPLSNPSIQNAKDVIPQGEFSLTGVRVCAEKFLLIYNEHAVDHLYTYDRHTQTKTQIPMPAPGAVGISADKNEPQFFYSFTSFTFPTSIFQYNPQNGQSKQCGKLKMSFNPQLYTTQQIFYRSKDGTKIPMFLTYHKDLKRDGSNPVYLYGYGGFNISLRPSFSASRIAFLESGGIYAQVNLRGGGEYGEDWHKAGTKRQKQNVFDDFAAAAHFLIDSGYSAPKKIAIVGRSNGGLLIGACVNQHPDLFGVAVPMFGVMDMLRYHLFTIGWNWAPDYGIATDSREMYAYLKAYSPLHNIRNNVDNYPAILVTTADHDDRVVPSHSFKYTAALQAALTGPKPKMIRIDTKAGHGAGTPTRKRIEEQADVLSFIMQNLNMEPGF